MMDTFKSTIKNITQLSPDSPDSYLIGKDGRISLHFVLMAVHSDLLRDIFKTIPSVSDFSIILPDFCLHEIVTFGGIMYGLSLSGFVSKEFLQALGMFNLDKIISQYLGDILMIDDGPLKGFHLVEPERDHDDSPPGVDDPINILLSSEKFGDNSDVINQEMEQAGLIIEARNEDIGVQETVEITTSPEPEQNEYEVTTTPESEREAVGVTPEQDDNLLAPNPSGIGSVVDQEIKCNVCSFKFKHKRYLRVHMKIKHTTDPTVTAKAKKVSKDKSQNRLCTICNNLFHSRNILSHIREMHPEVSLGHTCQLCPMTFTKSWMLKRHIAAVHEQERKFNCAICSFKAKRLAHIADHMNIHNQVMVLTCDKCGFRTLRKRELRDHKCRVRNFQCDFCDLKTVTKDALRMHINRVHK